MFFTAFVSECFFLLLKPTNAVVSIFFLFFNVFILFLHLNYLNLNDKHIKLAFMSAAHRLVAHYRESMGVFTRHQWALLPAHKESRSRVCAQCESLRSEAALSSVLLGSILWKCSWRRSRNTRLGAYRPRPANVLMIVGIYREHSLLLVPSKRAELSAERKHCWSRGHPLFFVLAF